MDKTIEAWKGHLVMIGEDAFHSSLAKNSTPVDYDPTPILEAVAAMIAENDAAHR